MEETNASAPKLDYRKLSAIIIIGVVVIGFGTFGVGKVLDNIDPSRTYETKLKITDMRGNDYKLSDYYGQVVVLYFYYRSCTYCKKMGPTLDEITEGYSLEDVIVFALSVSAVDKNVDLMEEWQAEQGYDHFILVYDKDGDIFSQFTVSGGVPHVVFLNVNGTVESNVVGYSPVAGATKSEMVSILDEIVPTTEG